MESTITTVECKKEQKSLPFFCCQSCYHVYRTKEDFESSHSCCSIDDFKGKKTLNNTKLQTQYFGILELLRSHHRFICAYCQEEFRNFQRVNFHIEHCDGRPPFQCPFCTNVFQGKKDLNVHKETVHQNERPFRCPYCSGSTDTSFKRNSSLQKHLINKHESKQCASFKCDKCPKRFIKKVYLTNHKTKFHNITKPFLCQACGDSFMRNTTLNEHMKSHCGNLKQSISKPSTIQTKQLYPCPYCKKIFKRKDKLNFHTSIHTGERLFTCELCPK